MTRRLTDRVKIAVPYWLVLIAACFVCGIAWGLAKAVIVWIVP